MAKAAEAFRTISEVADDLGIQKHVLRFWEAKFSQIRPMKRGGGRRYYRPEDMELLRGIRKLLHRDGYTIKGVQKILREQGVEAVKQRARAGDAAASETAQTRTAVAAPVEPALRERKRGARKGGLAPEPAPTEADRTQVLRRVLEELAACRDILSGRAPASEPEARAPAASRSRRSA
jgi:DNA-binding transcriptional MerR regulator